MSRFKDKIDHLGDSLKHKARIFDADHIRGIKQQIRTTINPNHRHDEEHEKEVDRQIQAIRDSHRFNSFAPETSGSIVRSHVDGHDFFWAVSIMLEEAKTSIMILDWWLSPELYLRRPPAQYPEYRLDRLLKRKAEEGVKIYICVYKEVTQTMSMSSSHTKHELEEMHENISVMRHPDHLGGEQTLYWSHHEKMTIVDSTRATVGGLDLCFGRWDLHDHPLADVHPTHFERTLFPGQDYNNARVLDFQAVDKFTANAVDTATVTRMPWHDTSMTLQGPVVVDLQQHFVERWNFVKHLKYKHDERYEWLALPHRALAYLLSKSLDSGADNKDLLGSYDTAFQAPIKTLPSGGSSTIQNSAAASQEDGLDAAMRNERRREHPHLQDWLDRGRAHFHPYHEHPSKEPRAEEEVPQGSCRVQAVRSSADWSHGILKEDSIQRAYAQMILESHCAYLENQFWITQTEEGHTVQNLIGRAIVQRILSAARSGTKFKMIIVIPEMPAFPGDLSAQGGLKIMSAQYQSINRGGQSIMEAIEREGVDPKEYIRWYNLRSYDRINAPASFIKKMEERSGVNFHEAQVALAKVWVGGVDVGESKEVETVDIKTAEDEAGTVDQLEAADKGDTLKDVKVPKTMKEAEDLIRRFEAGADRPDEIVADNVGQHSQADKTALMNEKWMGTEEEEREAYVTELTYIHSKIMIVDDRRVICGSANLNDRSQKGDGDSEIALVVEDTDMIECEMDGKPYLAARFAKQWRHQLMKEHLGLLPPQGTHPFGENPKPAMLPAPHEHEDFFGTDADRQVSDPLSDDFLALWEGRASKNREIFTEVFKTLPHDSVQTWADYKKASPQGIKTGHVADPDMPLQVVKEKLSQVKGHLVTMPIEFLKGENSLVDFGNIVEVNRVTLPIYL